MTVNDEGFCRHLGWGTNNQAEYGALIAALDDLLSRVQSQDVVAVCGDSELVISQVTGEYGCNRATSIHYLGEQQKSSSNSSG